MCLSTAYRNTKTPEAIFMKNVMEIQIKDLTKEFQGVKAVDGINLTMSRGIYGLLGVNGAGKTTLLGRRVCSDPRGGAKCLIRLAATPPET